MGLLKLDTYRTAIHVNKLPDNAAIFSLVQLEAPVFPTLNKILSEASLKYHFINQHYLIVENINAVLVELWAMQKLVQKPLSYLVLRFIKWHNCVIPATAIQNLIKQFKPDALEMKILNSLDPTLTLHQLLAIIRLIPGTVQILDLLVR